jgi:hypothetical protein
MPKLCPSGGRELFLRGVEQRKVRCSAPGAEGRSGWEWVGVNPDLRYRVLRPGNQDHPASRASRRAVARQYRSTLNGVVDQ